MDKDNVIVVRLPIVFKDDKEVEKFFRERFPQVDKFEITFGYRGSENNCSDVVIIYPNPFFNGEDMFAYFMEYMVNSNLEELITWDGIPFDLTDYKMSFRFDKVFGFLDYRFDK